MSLEQDNLELEKAKFDEEKRKNKEGYKFRTYVVPVTSIITTFIVACIGILSYCQQRDSKNSEIALKQEEVSFTKEKTKQEFLDRKRKEAVEIRQDFDLFLEKYKNDLSSATIERRKAVTDKILERYDVTAPNLVIDFFRNFRDEVYDKKTDGEDEQGKLCAGDLTKCSETTLEYYKRAGLMNYIRHQINGKITIYIFCNNPENRKKIAEIVKDEGFAVGSETDSDYTYIGQNLKDFSVNEVRFFYEQNETFANTIQERLNEKLQFQQPSANFRKIYLPEMDYRSLRMIAVIYKD